MDKLHNDGKVSIDLDGATYVLTFGVDETFQYKSGDFSDEKNIKDTLKKIYHIVSGNRRDYLNIPDSLIKELKKI